MNRRMSVVRREKAGSALGIGLKVGPNGHRVTAVKPKSAGESAGLSVGDVITHVNGTKISEKTVEQVMLLFEAAGAEFSVVLEREGEIQQMSSGLSQAGPSGEGIGITLVTGGVFGARSAVTSVLPNSLGSRAGLHPGDIIVSVNGRSMVGLSHPEVVHALKTVTADQIEIGVERGNDRVTAKTTSAMVLELGVVVELTTEGLVQVIECFVNGSADRAGIRVGDILLAVDGQALIKRKSFAKSVGILRAADPATANLVVSSRPRVVALATAGGAAGGPDPAQQPPPRQPPRATKHYVVEVSRLTIGGGKLEPLGMGLGTDDDGMHHVTVVLPDGAAERAGLIVGDKVEMINGRALDGISHADLMAVVASTGANVALGLARDASRAPPERQTLRQAPRTVLVTDSFTELEF